MVEWRGRKQNLSRWSKELSLPYNLLNQRINVLGWDVERAFTLVPPKPPIAEIPEINSVEKLFEYDGRKLSILQWASEVGLNSTTIYARIKAGWPMERVLNVQPPNRKRLELEYKGRVQGIAEWASEVGLKPVTLRHRVVRLGWEMERALNPLLGVKANYALLLEYDGRKQTISDWAKEVGLKETTVRARIKAGWPIERTLNEKSQRVSA